MSRRIVATLAETGPGGGWEARVGDAAPRALDAVPTSLGRLPVPPDGTTLAAADLAEALDRLDRNEPGARDSVAVGQHLLACLIADADWATWRDSGDDLQLVVTTDSGELHRLPWELLHDGQRFLATRSAPAVTICRAVGAADGARQAVAVRPSVLVVVGDELDEPALQPAAEYLALLDALRRGSLAIDAHLVVGARPDDVKDACADLHPDVVHVIAHGDQLANGTGYVVLAPPKKGNKPVQVDAEQLITLLEAGGELPRVLVLTACRTAANRPVAALLATAPGGPAGVPAPDAFTFQPSLAADCVARGVPIVAAMTGAIASPACREFTFGFYGSLFTGGDVVAAAAAGRRAAFVGGDPPARAVDWAYPVVFCGPGFDGTVTVTTGGELAARASRARDLLERFQSPRAFCGRQEILDAFRRLVVPTVARTVASSVVPTVASDPAVLALCVPDDVATKMRVGASRALAQLGATAALAGYAVASVVPDTGDDRAVTFRKLVGQLVYQAGLGAEAIGTVVPQVKQILLLRTPDHPALDPRLGNLLEIAGEAPDSDQAIGLALRLDLTATALAVREAGGRGLVVLIDDLHTYGPAVAPLLREAGNYGLGTAEARVPLVFSYGEVNDTAGSGAVEEVREFVQPGPVIKVKVRPFAPPGAWLAYQQLLLGADKPLVPTAESRQAVFETLHDRSNGNPDEFDKDRVMSAIMAFSAVKALVPATDLERLAQLTGQG
jgi:CHAT domain-containing protein